ncbi:MAG: TerB family tellurite resistance protein [Alphaproteobacteria bacterium]
MSIFKKISNLISATPEKAAPKLSIEEAVAGLMFEVALLDQDFAEAEQQTLLTCLGDAFDMNATECQTLLDQVQERERTKAGVHPLVKLLNKQLDENQRFEVMVRIWQVVLADGRIADIEKQFMRRLAALLHISDRDSGLARVEAQSVASS